MSFSKIILRPVTIPLSWLYCLTTALRNILYNRKILKSIQFAVPVISVGNITAGGTGKTPFVIALTNWLEERDYNVGVISRGYRRHGRGQVIVKDGRKILASVNQAGDEPFLIARKTGHTVVIVDADRCAAAYTAIQKYGCDIIVADDAFQHRRLNRQLDIVLWDCHHDPAKERVLPAGHLRESIKELKRADLILISRSEKIPTFISDFMNTHFPDSDIATLPLTTEKIYNFVSETAISSNEITRRKVLGFCGLGNPWQFFDTLVNMTGSDTIIRRIFPDHHKYTEREIQSLQRTAFDNNCNYLLTTAKDAVNLPESAQNIDNVFVVEVTFKITEKMGAVILANLPPH